MNPDDNQNPQPPVYAGNSLEYLDSIAPKKPSRFSVVNKKVILLAGLVLAIIITAIFYAISTSSPSAPSGEVLGARYDVLSELIKYGDGDKVSDANLRKALVESKLVAASSKYQMSQIATLTPKDKKPPPAESASGAISTLDSAVASGNFLKTYSITLVAQINKIITSLQEMRGKLTSQTSTSKIDTQIINLTEISSRLSNY